MKTAGLDLGTNSIGITVRDTSISKNLKDQLIYFSSVIFKSGVGNGKSGEFSYAGERTKHRSVRRLYQARKYRIWETLGVLIQYGYCPLTLSDLEKWSRYDKSKGLKRKYPIDAHIFEQWVRLDFDCDGIPEYNSPYELRAELATKQLDFSLTINKYKLGRALYHLAQRRGFKSSKGETIKEQESENKITNFENEDFEITSSLKKSEEKKSKGLLLYMQENDLPTVGCAFYHLLTHSCRVRNSEYQAVRSQIKDEINYIFSFQNELDCQDEFYKRIISEKRKEGTIFFKRPLRSQKGLVGKCTLEPTKSRCPVSHPDFERFRAFSFINSIKFRKTNLDIWYFLSIEQKHRLYHEKFLRTTPVFKFSEIRIWLEKDVGFKLDYSQKTINYKDKASVAGCPISGRLKNLFGNDWLNFELVTDCTRLNKKTGLTHKVSYDIYDVWHVCFSSDDAEQVEIFAREKLMFDADKAASLTKIWGAIQQGYAQLSLKAIKNINRFLEKGYIYSDAVILAKLPDVFGVKKWTEVQNDVISEIFEISNKNRTEKRIINIVNALIARYKTLDEDEQFAFRNPDYILQNSDYTDIEEFAKENYGDKSWKENFSISEKENIIKQISDYYQHFFSQGDHKRDYIKQPKLVEAIKEHLLIRYPYLKTKNFENIYHPSMIEFYKPSKEEVVEYNGISLSLKLLQKPTIGSLKNPVALRTLHTLRKQINDLLISNCIDESTRIVVETARDMNDSNMRWAIEEYQNVRKKENDEFKKAIQRHFSNEGRPVSDDEITKVRLMMEQQDIPEKGEIYLEVNKNDKDKNNKTTSKVASFNKDVTKYKLWIEQGCRCIYTGKVISLSKLFDDNAVDFEHTIPRSLSFDDSLENLTVCDAYYNRNIKKNQIPYSLPNYLEIIERIRPWIEKVEKLKDNVEFWKNKSKFAQDKETKDKAIRQRHLWKMELDYWQNKVERFKMQEVTSGFRNSQLVDTRIITKYAYHYLKTVFNNVEVQKGTVTSNFRKIIGIQSVDEKKNRDKHSHHAIDATVLTLIPPAAKRDRMLELFYKIQENKWINNDTELLTQELEKEKASCYIGGNISEVPKFIEENILVNHINKDQTLTPAKRKARKRGKEILVKNKNGEFVNKWLKGDSIRGQLHKDTIFGAIKYPEVDSTGKPIKDNNRYVYPEKEVITMVKRYMITDFKTEKDIEKIIDPTVKRSIEFSINKRKAEGKSFTEAILLPIWMIDLNEKEIKVNKKGEIIHPIRHVRCKVAAGKGFFTKEKALTIKEQTYKSSKKLKHINDRSYKEFSYAQNDGNYLCLLYESNKNDKIERKFRIINYLETAKIQAIKINDILNEPFFNKIEVGKKEFLIKAVIKVGTKVLFWKNNPNELLEINQNELFNRLFIVYKFNLKGADCVYLQNHLEARNDNEIKEDYTNFDNTKYQPRLTLVANSLNCLIEGIHFKIKNGNKILFTEFLSFL